MSSPPIVAFFARGREIGFVVLRGREVWRYGVKTVTGKRLGQTFVRRVEKAVGDVLFFALPRSVIVVEQRRLSKHSGALGRVLPEVLKRWEQRGYPRIRLSLSEVKQKLCGSQKVTHQELIQAVGGKYPLLWSLVAEAKAHTKYWEKVFIAATFGEVTMNRLEERGDKR